MSFQLIIINGPEMGRTFPLSAGSPLIIGRGQTSHTKLVDPHTSRNHCVVRLEAGRVLVTDSGSVGGTFLNGQRIATQQLRTGDVIRVGETDLRFESPAEEATLPPPPVVDDSPAPTPAKDIVFAQKARGHAVPKHLQELHDLVGKSLGSYQILKVVGTGTIGVVFQAKDGKDQKTVALKVLKFDFARDDKARQRFIRGIKTACPLNHPNLVALHNAGITDGRCWIALEYIEGESLAQIMKAGKMEWPRAWQVAVHIASALGYIHDLGVVHRNVMPQNIMIQSRDQVAKLGDVMLAKALDEENGQAVTASGELVGNLYYLAPERTLGKEDDVDGRADLYSLGATIYALLTGQHPVQASSLVEVITKIRTANPERPRRFQSAIPESFEAIVMKMLAKRPDDRFQTAAQLLVELDRVRPINK
jgi:serine/threonine protein kinase